MAGMTPTDRILARTVSNYIKRIREHLEAMQRDAHGIEFTPWKREVDALWKITFEQINRMSAGPQQSALEMIRDPWMTYISHYAVMDNQGTGD